ncbi:MAG: hypothetical protein PVJ73_11245 [Acidobacteriota bacterium]
MTTIILRTVMGGALLLTAESAPSTQEAQAPHQTTLRVLWHYDIGG